MERRSTFRFRLPWSQPTAAPAPKPGAPKPRSPPPVPKPSGETGAPRQPSTTSKSPLSETPEIPPQPSAESKTPTQPSTTNSTPENAPANPKSETQTPIAPITATPTSTIAKGPSSSPPGVDPSPSSQTPSSKTESQPLIPSQERRGITSEPASPSDVATKLNESQPPSPPPSPPPSRSAPRLQEMTPTSSPTSKGRQVLSTDQLTSKSPHPASQTSNPPSGITSQMQPKDQTVVQPTSPLKPLQESSQPSSKSTEALTSSSVKEPKPTESLPVSEQMELFQKETSSDRDAKTKLGSTEKETREVKEVVQETRDKNNSTAGKIGGFLTSREKPSMVFQAKQAYEEKQAGSNNGLIPVNPVSNRKQTRTFSSQLQDKTVVSSSSKEKSVSAEQDTPLNKEIKDNLLSIRNGKQNLDERSVNVITLAGDNRGASMQLGSDSNGKEGAIHIRRGYKLNPDESTDATTDAEGSSEGRRLKDARTAEDKEIEAYMNCNVQGLNNSIIFDSSISVKSPGIHMSFPRMTSEPVNSSDETGALEAHKAEFNVTPSQKLTYEPTIRRRCLRGLFH